MTFEPEPGTSINLNGETIEFISLDSSGPAAVFVYAESGKEGVVYKVLKGREFYALKVFYPEYRDKRLLETTEKLNRFKDLEGFRVAERTVINHEIFPKVVDKYPELNYSVLMPWVEGSGWGNFMVTGDLPLQRENYFQIARTLMKVVCNLETQGLAHCDLSNNNFIIDQELSSIQLIDIEDMYAPDMPRPIPDISYGTIGYRTKWIAEKGLWGPESDRFASAILCSEIITWHNREIRENRSGDTSFFDETEIGEDSERYKIMARNLGDINTDFQPLFKRAWFSEGPDQCPSIAEWMNVIEEIGTPITQEEEKVPPHEENPQESPTIVHAASDTLVTRGVPPKMEISQDIFDFGVLRQPGANLQFFISNSGGAILTGKINSESWMVVSPNRFLIPPGEKQDFKVSLNTGFPRPKSGFEYRTPNALSIESNAGGEIIGAIYKLEKMPFYKSWWRRTLAGAAAGAINSSFLLLLLLATGGFSELSSALIPIIIMVTVCGLAGLISYPHKLSIVFLAVGFAAMEALLFFLFLSSTGDISLVNILTLTSLAIPLGLIAGSIVSRIVLWILHYAKLLK